MTDTQEIKPYSITELTQLLEEYRHIEAAIKTKQVENTESLERAEAKVKELKEEEAELAKELEVAEKESLNVKRLLATVQAVESAYTEEAETIAELQKDAAGTFRVKFDAGSATQSDFSEFIEALGFNMQDFDTKSDESQAEDESADIQQAS